jgi:hypothetical protein
MCYSLLNSLVWIESYADLCLLPTVLIVFILRQVCLIVELLSLFFS